MFRDTESRPGEWVDTPKIKNNNILYKDRYKTSYNEKFCNQTEAERLINNGWGAIDLHVHTWCSYDVLPLQAMDPLVLYNKARQKGFRFITFTDHDTMDAYDRVGWTREGIVPGVEIKILDPKRVGHTLHINIFQLNKKQFLELEEIAQKDQNIETFVQYLRENKLDYVYNHPFWHEQYEKPNLKGVMEVSELFPVIEYNMGRVNILNQKAMQLAEMKGAGIVAGTDTHIGAIGRTFTLAKGKTFTEFFNEVKAGRSLIMPRYMTVNRLTYEVNQRISHLFAKEEWMFEKPSYHINTGIKAVDDLVLQLVKSPPQYRPTLKKIIRSVLRTINRSRIPASLHIKAQYALGQRIDELFTALAPQQAEEFQPQVATVFQPQEAF